MENKTILIVEDSQDDKDLIIRAFKKSELKARVDVVRDGAEALEYMNGTGKFEGKTSYDIPDLILLDLKLPKIDGKEVLQAIREDKSYCLVPVIILSSSGEHNDVNDCYKLGANSYIKKPIDFKRFLEIISVLITYWLTINEQARL
jgi:two-component system, response regulator